MEYLNTRDLAEELEELEANKLALEEAQAAYEKQKDSAWAEVVENAESELQDAKADFDEDAADRLEALRTLRSEIGGGSFDDGVTLIPDDDFAEYIGEWARDNGSIPRNLPDYIAIDWVETADNLRSGFGTVVWEGSTYLYRD